MIKKLLLNALHNDPDFARTVLFHILEPELMVLEPEKSYILVLSDNVSMEDVAQLTKMVPQNINFAVITDASAKLIELTKE